MSDKRSKAKHYFTYHLSIIAMFFSVVNFIDSFLYGDAFLAGLSVFMFGCNLELHKVAKARLKQLYG